MLLADVKLVSAALYSDGGHATPHTWVIKLHVWNFGAKSICQGVINFDENIDCQTS